MTRLFIGLAVVGTVFLAVSVTWSGYFYQFDNDEVFHVNLLYQIARGAHPFTSFFTIYTPVFHWILLPVYYVFGPTFSTFYALRVLMIILFFSRIALSVRLLFGVFGKEVAWVFVLLILLDPLTVFSGMQIRPDNLMFTTVLIGYVLLERALRTKKNTHFFWSGMLFGLAVIVLIKSLPIIAVTAGVLGLTAIDKNKRLRIAHFFGGLLLPIFVFVLFFVLIGELEPMIQGVFVDPLILFRSLLFPNNFRLYYRADNVFLFGVMGKPSAWYYTIGLPFVGIFGTMVYLFKSFMRKRFATMPIILLGVLIMQAIVIYKSPSVFVQYFLTFNWLLAVFAAVAIVWLYRVLEKFRMAIGAVLCGVVIFAVIIRGAVLGNIARSGIGNQLLEKRYREIWQIIPPEEPTFHNFLFRPSVYPLLIGSFYGDIPEQILARFPTIIHVIESHKLKYLLLSDYYISFLPSYVKKYISDHYTLTGTTELYRRNK